MTEEEQARVDAQALVKGFRSYPPLIPDIIDKALASVLPDFEDNIQLMSAETIIADHIVTRNKKHFQPAPISVLTPEEWLALDAVAGLEANLQDLNHLFRSRFLFFCLSLFPFHRCPISPFRPFSLLPYSLKPLAFLY